MKRFDIIFQVPIPLLIYSASKDISDILLYSAKVFPIKFLRYRYQGTRVLGYRPDPITVPVYYNRIKELVLVPIPVIINLIPEESGGMIQFLFNCTGL